MLKTCVSAGTLESGGRRAPDREVFLGMDACIRSGPRVRGGLVDPISAGSLLARPTMDGAGCSGVERGGKEESVLAEPAALAFRLQFRS